MKLRRKRKGDSVLKFLIQLDNDFMNVTRFVQCPYDKKRRSPISISFKYPCLSEDIRGGIPLRESSVPPWGQYLHLSASTLN